MSLARPDTALVPRRHALDIARGLAVAAMVVYHFAWDLRLYSLIPIDVVSDPGWRLFARAIAASFLSLVGYSLVLAHGGGLRVRAFLKRLGVIASAALVITVVTWFTFPDSYIFFGILHGVALSSVLALPFLRAPPWVAAIAAAFCFAAPFLFTQPFLDAPWLAWLGLGSSDPVTNDYIPIFPWFGFVLLGLAGARLWDGLAGRTTSSSSPSSPLARSLAWSGRHSLAVYLIHQPLLLGALFPLAQAIGPHPGLFTESYVENCRGGGHDEAACRRAAACVVAWLKGEDLWSATMDDRLSEQERARLNAASQQCFTQRTGG